MLRFLGLTLRFLVDAIVFFLCGVGPFIVLRVVTFNLICHPTDLLPVLRNPKDSGPYSRLTGSNHILHHRTNRSNRPIEYHRYLTNITIHKYMKLLS